MDQVKFAEIEEAYNELTKKDKTVSQIMRPTKHGLWHPTIAQEAFDAFMTLDLATYGSFLDLGSGDGRVALIASLFVPQATGVESDKKLHVVSKRMKKQLACDNVLFEHQDFMKHDISGYDVLYSFPDAPFYRGMEEKLHDEMAGKLIVCGSHFQPRFLRELKCIRVNGTPFTLYSK